MSDAPDSSSAGGPRFATTRWSVVLEAARQSPGEAGEALEMLCRVYWYPLYAYARRRGRSAQDAMDLTQGFFTRVIERDYLEAADQSRGRFRSFLLTMFKRYAAREREHADAIKRGGQVRVLSLDVDSAEALYQREPATEQTPERIFERRWALTLLQRVLDELGTEYTGRGRGDLFAACRVYLTGVAAAPDYATTAASLGMTEGALKVAVHRLRDRYRKLLKDEVALTVGEDGDVEDELRCLLQAVQA